MACKLPHTPLALIFLALLVGHTRSLDCTKPLFNHSLVLDKPVCLKLNQVCVDQNSFVLYSDPHNPTSTKFKGLPKYDVSKIFFDYYGIPDVWGVQRTYPAVVFRPATAGEETQELRKPTFSNCTVPIVLYESYVYTYGQILAKVLPALTAVRKYGQLEGVTLVFATLGMKLKSFHFDLLGHLSNYTLTTLSHMSSRLPEATPETYSKEQTHVRCFEELHLCKSSSSALTSRYSQPLWSSAQFLLNTYLPRMKEAPADFKSPGTLRVVFALRRRTRVNVRTILNLDAVLAWCNAYKPQQGYSKTVCISIKPTELVADLAVYQNADVVVGIHGSMLTNSLFMKQHSSVVEIRPFQFGGWANILLKDPLRAADNDSILWWGYNTMEAANSAPGDMEKFRRGASIVWPRDRHVIVNTTVLEHIFNKIVWVGRNVTKYNTVRKNLEYFYTDTLVPVKD